METIMSRKFDHTRIAVIRLSQELSQRRLSEKSEIPIDTLRMYEQGRTVPSVERLAMLANALGCSVDEFFTDEG